MAAAWLLARRREVESGMDPGEDLPEVHASASGLKALGAVLAADGIEDLRRCCGGHGYRASQPRPRAPPARPLGRARRSAA